MSASGTSPSRVFVRSPAEGVGFAVGSSAGAVLIGVLVAHGGFVAFALVGVCAELALIGVAAALGFRALLIWLALGPLAYPWIRSTESHTLVSFDRAWIVGSFAALAGGLLYARASRSSRRLAATLVWLAVVFAIRAALTSGGRFSALSIWFDAIVLPLLLFQVARRLVTTTTRVERVLAAFTVAGLILALTGIGETLFGFELASRSGGAPRFDEAVGIVRISGPYSAPEPYALALLLCFAATLGWLQLQVRRAAPLVFAIVVAALEATAISLSFFRAAWLAMVIIFIAAFGIRRKRIRRLLGVTALVALVGYAALGPLEQNRLFSARLGGQVAQGNVNARLATYKQAYGVFRSAPLFGIGVSRYEMVHGDVANVTYGGVQAQAHPHSSYVGMLAEQGLFGFVPLVAASVAAALLLRAYRKCAFARTDVVVAACAYGAALAYLIMSLTLTMLPYGVSNMFFLLLLGVVSARLDNLESPQQSAVVVS
jgi:O-Antigen ligase